MNGGISNTASNDYASLGGGRFNSARGLYSVVSGGGGATAADSNLALGDYSAIGGGTGNTASGEKAAIGGGSYNTASGNFATVSGGGYHNVTGQYATVGGGYSNNATTYATVGGGQSNTASGQRASISGGAINIASGNYATVGGGYQNTVSGPYATVPGGQLNEAGGGYSFAAGYRAKAVHDGAFVWADSTDADFSSTASNQFLIRAAGGVGIGTDSPQAELDVNGAIRTAAGQSFKIRYGLGSAIVSIGPNGIVNVSSAVSFGYTFSSAPKVIITGTVPNSPALAGVIPNTLSVSTTGFDLQLFNGGNVGASGEYHFDWIAIGI